MRLRKGHGLPTNAPYIATDELYLNVETGDLYFRESDGSVGQLAGLRVFSAKPAVYQGDHILIVGEVYSWKVRHDPIYTADFFDAKTVTISASTVVPAVNQVYTFDHLDAVYNVPVFKSADGLYQLAVFAAEVYIDNWGSGIGDEAHEVFNCDESDYPGTLFDVAALGDNNGTFSAPVIEAGFWSQVAGAYYSTRPRINRYRLTVLTNGEPNRSVTIVAEREDLAGVVVVESNTAGKEFVRAHVTMPTGMLPKEARVRVYREGSGGGTTITPLSWYHNDLAQGGTQFLSVYAQTDAPDVGNHTLMLEIETRGVV